MIGMLHGRVESVDMSSALIEVGGVGYETRMPSADLASSQQLAKDGSFEFFANSFMIEAE